ncbi:flagellin [Paenibacillus sp. FSL R7-0273]|uniref:flagellin N-terminal helical domain-containing protein n=1 Tax=Paenibacillus sp. FSL R7-0273 TaxID=1536772 RepID=UPI0004F69DCC|nr:flagellin [Paenibacillus sp. FSL R7-0273]AIQ49708.1 flagellin [Paenibacillus sp. FSL R7-0273]OMF90234.1 flagellin [Paenibacillus sp. FSL R7-0273]
MIINHNVTALNTHRQLAINTSNTSKNIEKLSSGLRINRAGDDAAGLAISEKMRGQIRGLDQASRNSQDGISMIQTAEGALNETHSILQRMRELAVQSANDTNVTADRAAIDQEYQALSTEITRISDDTEFNTQKLWDGTTTTVEFQVGANTGQKISYTFSNMDAATLTATGDLTTKANASTALAAVDVAIGKVSTERSKLGAVQNRLEHTINNLNTSSENLTAAESRVRDVDMAKEMMAQTKNNILAQAAQAMLAQANQQPQGVLQLLR